MNDEIFDKENFNEEKILINLVWGNVFGIIVLAAALVFFGALFYLLGHTIIIPTINLPGLVLYFVVMISGIIAHEAIHGLFFALYAKGKFKSVKFGILPKEKLFTPYCHCKEILKINHYRVAAIMPLIILGIIPALVSLINGSIFLLLFGVLFICGGCGDLLMLLKIIKEKNNTWIYDLPDDVGFIIYRPKS